MKQITIELSNANYFRLQIAKSLFDDGILTGSASLMLLGFIEPRDINDLDVILPQYREFPGRIVIKGPNNEYGNKFCGKLELDKENRQIKEDREYLISLEEYLRHKEMVSKIINWWPHVDILINPAEPYKTYQIAMSTKVGSETLSALINLKLADARNTVRAKLQYLLQFDKDKHYRDCMMTLARLYGKEPLHSSVTFKDI